jgi:autotransporter translocation and assembly factor TamB
MLPVRRRHTVFAVFFALCWFWLAWAVPRASRVLHERLQPLLSRQLRQPVGLGGVQLHPMLLSVSFRDLRVGPAAGSAPDVPPLFACDRWTVQLVPFRWRDSYPWIAFSFGVSFVENPRISLPPPGPSAGGPPPWERIPVKAPWFLHHITWTGGRVSVAGGPATPAFEWRDVAGELGSTPEGTRLQARGTGDWGALALAATLHPTRRWSLRADVDGLPLRRLSDWRPAAGRLDGVARVAFQAGASGTKGHAPEWSADVSFDGGLWTPPPDSPVAAPVTFEGSLSADRRQVRFGAFRLLGGLLKAEGRVADPWGPDARWDARVTAADSSLAAAARLLPDGHPLSAWKDGRLDLDARVSGPAAAPRVEARAALRGAVWGAVALPPVEATVRVSTLSLNVDASLLGGRLAVSGLFAPPQGRTERAWNARFQNLRLGEWTRLNRWGEIDGVLGGRARLRGGPSPSAHGDIVLQKLVWGSHREEQPLTAEFSYQDGGLVARGLNNALTVRFRKEADRLDLAELSFELPSGLQLNASGSVSGPDHRLDFTGRLHNWALRDVPFLLARHPGITGTFGLEGTLTGTRESPVVEGRLQVRDFRVDDRAAPLDADAALRWTREDWSVQDLRAGTVLTASAKGHASGAWDVEADLAAADVRGLAPLLAPGVESGGTLDGHVRLSAGPGGRLRNGEGRFAWSEGRWGAVAFQGADTAFHVDAAGFALEHLEVRQSSGSWRAQGVFPLGPDDAPWQTSVQFKHFAAGRAVLDGEINADGRSSGKPRRWSGRWSSPNFWVNGLAVGAPGGRLAWDGRRFSVSDLHGGFGLGGRLSVDFRERSLEGALTLRGLSLAEWGPRWGVTSPLLSSGRLDADLSVRGPIAGPSADFDAAWKDVRWNGLPLDASARGRAEPGTVRLDALRLESPEGGAVEGEGALRWASATSTAAAAATGPDVDLALRLLRVPAATALRAAGLKTAWKGTFDGTLAWRGPLSAPEVTGGLEGGPLEWGASRLTGWRTSIAFRDRELRFTDFSARTPEGLWNLRDGSRFIFTGPGEGRLHLVGDLRNIHLGPISLFGGLEAVGRWTSSPAVSLDCSLRAQSLWVNQQRFDQDIAQMKWEGGRITFVPAPGGLQQVAGTVHLEALPQVRFEEFTLWEGGEKRFWMDGTVGPEAWDFRLQGWRLPAATLIGLADWDVPVEGLLDVSLRGTGSAAKPRVDGAIVGENGSLGRIPYDRFEAFVLWNGPVLEIKDLLATRKGGYVVKGEGRVPLAADASSQDWDFSLKLTNGNLNVLTDVWPDCRAARGDFRGELTFRPGPEGIRSSGYLIVEDGEIKADRYFRHASDLNARLLLKDNRLVFENFSGRVGAGRLLVQGTMGVRGFNITDYDLTVESVGSRGVAVEAPQLAVPPGPLLKRFSVLRESLESTSRGEPLVYLKLTGPDGEQLVQGTVVLNDTQFTYPPAKKLALREGTWWAEFLNETNWDIVFKCGDDTWYRNEYVNVLVRGQMRLEGKRRAFRGSGKVETDRGVITYLGQGFRVKHVAFEVVTDTRAALGAETAVTPYLWGEAERSAVTPDQRNFSTPDTILMVVDRAPLGEIQPRFISRNNPGLSSERVAQLALGLTQEKQLTPAERDQLLRAGLVQLVGTTAGPLATRLAQRFGIDILYPIYEPPETVSTGLPGSIPGVPVTAAEAAAAPGLRDLSHLLQGTGASAGIQLSDRVFGVYKFKVDQTENQSYFRDELELIYRVRGNLHLRASTELDTEKLLGQPPNRQAVIENQWRFGQPPPARPSEPSQNPPAATP